ncbi:MAG: hypothetical protein M1839_005407 [Geoglossum umbratile]|nr:MAG: hypothetical protein M1839_005407 [Geoglossum umbratile]
MEQSSASGRPAGASRGRPIALEQQEAARFSDLQNEALSRYLLIICACISVILIIWRVWDQSIMYVRTATSIHSNDQRYFATPNQKLSFFKRNILYAPIFRKRHSHELQLSRAVNVGTLPSRLELLFLASYFATNIVFCVINIPFASSFTDAALTLGRRTGSLSVVNMIPLFLMAGKNNPLIKLLGISYDTFNLYHRWLGRIVSLEAVVHTFAHLANLAHTGGWKAGIQPALSMRYMSYGLLGTCALAVICIQASSPIRHAFYEMFKLLHIALVIVVVISTWYHLQLKGLPQTKYLIPAVILWGIDRLCRMIRVAYGNIGKGGTKAIVEVLPGNACRVTVSMARPWTFRSGQHAYIYMPAISLWQSHPFSVAWSEEEEDSISGEKSAKSPQGSSEMRKTNFSFIIRARAGFTNTLYKKVSACPDGKLHVACMVEGPYGGQYSMHSYGTVILFAGGVGITHQLPYIRDLATGYANGTIATKKIILIWIVQSSEYLEWIRPWMAEVLAMEIDRDVLRIMLFASQKQSKEICNPFEAFQIFPGRPNIDAVLDAVMEEQIGAMGVSVCGPGSLSDDVRRAVRNSQYSGTVDLIEESFSW